MKNAVAAAILAILFPFFGCFYSAPLYGLNCLIVAATLVSASIQFVRLNMPIEVFCSQALVALPYLASIFFAVQGVQQYNLRTAAELSGIAPIGSGKVTVGEALQELGRTAVLVVMLWLSTDTAFIQGFAEKAKLDAKYRIGEQR